MTPWSGLTPRRTRGASASRPAPAWFPSPILPGMLGSCRCAVIPPKAIEVVCELDELIVTEVGVKTMVGAKLVVEVARREREDHVSRCKAGSADRRHRDSG